MSSPRIHKLRRDDVLMCRSVAESMYAKTMANTDISIEEIKEKVKETWPKLEAVAKSVDVVNL